MFRSIQISRLIALLALLAWSNLQAMTCCWTMPAQRGSENIEVAVPMDEDHSCCPGGEEQTVPTSTGSPESAASKSANGDCGMPVNGKVALCCAPTVPAEVTAYSSQLSLVQIAFVASVLFVYPEKYPDPVFPTPAHASGGSPRYLALERILI